jgi:hypothetical protein
MLRRAGGKLHLNWGKISGRLGHLGSVQVRIPRLQVRVIIQNLLVHLRPVLAGLPKYAQRCRLHV